jgi:hypothetical protein
VVALDRGGRLLVHSSTLILNTSLPERIGTPNSDAGGQEVAFYKDVAATMQVELVPRCFEAEWEAGTKSLASSA